MSRGNTTTATHNYDYYYPNTKQRACAQSAYVLTTSYAATSEPRMDTPARENLEKVRETQMKCIYYHQVSDGATGEAMAKHMAQTRRQQQHLQCLRRLSRQLPGALEISHDKHQGDHGHIAREANHRREADRTLAIVDHLYQAWNIHLVKEDDSAVALCQEAHTQNKTNTHACYFSATRPPTRPKIRQNGGCLQKSQS